MPTAGSLNNPVLSNEDELSNLLSQLRLSQRSQSQATASPPPSLRRSLRGESDRRRRPPPVHQPFLAQLALSPERISLASSVNQDNSSNSAASQSNEPDPQSPVSSDEFTDARSHLSSSGYGDSSFDNTVASIAQDDLLSMGDAGPEARRPGKLVAIFSGKILCMANSNPLFNFFFKALLPQLILFDPLLHLRRSPPVQITIQFILLHRRLGVA